MSMNKMNTVHRSNRFKETVNRIAQKQRQSVRHIMSLVEDFSSADFCIESQCNKALDVLPQIIVDELRAHYDLYSRGPFRLHDIQMDHSQKAIVFIRNKLTEQLLNDQFILEHFDSAQRLYQFMNWTIIISKMAQTMALMEGHNGCNVLVVHTELHDQRRRDLYALCIPNDIVSAKAQKWQLAALLTATELTNLLGVHRQNLPRGVRATSFQFKNHRQISYGKTRAEGLRRMKAWIARKDSKGKVIRYQQLKCVRTVNARHKFIGSKMAGNALTVGLSDFHSMVRSALEDDEVELIPMASIVVKRVRKTKKENFSVDYLLPVQIGQDWVGVVYRGGVPTQALMDCYDITNKALLCDPSFDTERVAMFHHNSTYNRLKIVPDDDLESMDSITDTLQYTPSPEPVMEILEFDSCPSVSAVPTLTNMPSYTPSLSVTSSISSISVDSCASSVPTFLPTIVPIPFMPLGVMGVCPPADQLMQWVDQVVAHGKHNAAYFGQFMAPSTRL